MDGILDLVTYRDLNREFLRRVALFLEICEFSYSLKSNPDTGQKRSKPVNSSRYSLAVHGEKTPASKKGLRTSVLPKISSPHSDD